LGRLTNDDLKDIGVVSFGHRKKLLEAIAKLAGASGVAINRGTAGRPKLTRAGVAIVFEVKAVAYSVETLRGRVRGLVDGLESEVSFVVGSIFPSHQLVAISAARRDLTVLFPGGLRARELSAERRPFTLLAP
jgi:hypothetical protein